MTVNYKFLETIYRILSQLVVIISNSHLNAKQLQQVKPGLDSIQKPSFQNYTALKDINDGTGNRNVSFGFWNSCDGAGEKGYKAS